MITEKVVFLEKVWKKSLVTVYELLVGVEYLDGKDRPEIESIIKSSRVLPLNEEASREAARISARLRKSGQRIGIADELIAAICKISNVYLLTKNVDHFRRIEKLKIMGLEQI
jgi:tRNA(fMet)-specific endonuclease VapC